MLVNEEYETYPASGFLESVLYTIHRWTFYYDDGSVETVTMRKKNDKP